MAEQRFYHRQTLFLRLLLLFALFAAVQIRQIPPCRCGSRERRQHQHDVNKNGRRQPQLRNCASVVQALISDTSPVEKAAIRRHNPPARHCCDMTALIFGASTASSAAPPTSAHRKTLYGAQQNQQNYAHQPIWLNGARPMQAVAILIIHTVIIGMRLRPRRSPK